MESDQSEFFSNFLIFLKLDKTPYIALQNRLGRKLFFAIVLKKNIQITPKKAVRTKIHADKQIVEGCF